MPSESVRELENILVLVQIKDKNWTKYDSNLRKHFSYMTTDVDPPIIAHWFPFLGVALTTSARPTISPATRMRSREAAAADKTTTTAPLATLKAAASKTLTATSIFVFDISFGEINSDGAYDLDNKGNKDGAYARDMGGGSEERGEEEEEKYCFRDGDNNDSGTYSHRICPTNIKDEELSKKGRDDDPWPDAFPALVKQLPLVEKKKKMRANVADNGDGRWMGNFFCDVSFEEMSDDGSGGGGTYKSFHLPHQKWPSSEDGRVTTTTNRLHPSAACKVCVEMTTSFGRCICKSPKGQREGMEMMKKKRVDYVLTMEQQRTGTHFSRKRPYSL
jgi:hypothetical protein